MKIRRSRQGYSWAALCLLLMPAALPAHGRAHHSESWARERFAAAERMREALNGRPPADRTRHDYQRVLNSYRSVYYGAPTSTKADPSVVAVAETLVEMGRRFQDDKILNSAIGQYRFLRREYPGSKYRFDALFTVGEIYKDDLNNPELARAAFREFLKRYPHHRLAEDAERAIADLDKQASTRKAPMEAAAPKEKPASDPAEVNAPGPSSAGLASEDALEKFPRVTGIRHWSTPDYTRVAIDVEAEVKFASHRIPHPERIFFDLRDTRLASTLVGKSFDVDDGLLKKIRVAQFQPGRTRVVLEVDDLSEYQAFLLPNPYRLIIDVHGRDLHSKVRGKNGRSHNTKPAQQAAGADVEAGPNIGSGAEAAATAADVTAEAKNEVKQPADDADEETMSPVQAASDAAEKARPRRSVSTVQLPGGVTKTIVEADDTDGPADHPPAKHLGATARHAATGTPARKLDEDSSTGAEESNGPSDVQTAQASASAKAGSHAIAGKRASHKLEAREAQPNARGDRSLTRALGLKIGRIVIDPGHGGHDTGTIGPEGLEEKDLVLEVGRRLGRLLESRLGAEVVYTRKNDAFIPLETRTAIANRERADLFISIHANSSRDPGARGVETYYLNFTSSPEALEVAARENAVSEKSIYELQDLVKKIALKEKIEESREFAADVQDSLHDGLASKSPGIRNRGVKKAPFIVLIGANMPSILAEISFVSNPSDERRLETSEYRQRIAESLYRGIAKYVQGLSGVKVASKMDKAPAE